jgi:hypothetical protein
MQRYEDLDDDGSLTQLPVILDAQSNVGDFLDGDDPK